VSEGSLGCISFDLSGASCGVHLDKPNRKGETMKLTDAALDLYLWATEKGIVDETVEWIIETVLEQEIVSFATPQGTVSFDVNDIDWEV